MRRAVFLDRDGVLTRAVVRNGRPLPPASVAEVELLEGAMEACRRLCDAGFLLIVVSNQPDVARGSQRREVVEEINNMLLTRLPLDDIRVCYHDDGDACACRKPSPGLLLEAAASWGIALDHSFMVGDRWRDIEAGWRAGCRTIFIDHGYDEPPPHRPDLHTRSLADAVMWIVEQANGAREGSHEDRT